MGKVTYKLKLGSKRRKLKELKQLATIASALGFDVEIAEVDTKADVIGYLKPTIVKISSWLIRGQAK